MTPQDCLFCHFNNYLLKNHWLIYDMTGFDISQLWAHYGIHELELLSFSVMEFAASHLPDKMGPEGRQRWDAFDNIHIGVQERYKHITRCY